MLLVLGGFDVVVVVGIVVVDFVVFEGEEEDDEEENDVEEEEEEEKEEGQGIEDEDDVCITSPSNRSMDDVTILGMDCKRDGLLTLLLAPF